MYRSVEENLYNPDFLLRYISSAGESMSIKSPVYTRTPTMYLDFTLKPNSPPFTSNLFHMDGIAFVYMSSMVKVNLVRKKTCC